jgi:hypothetical protein
MTYSKLTIRLPRNGADAGNVASPKAKPKPPCWHPVMHRFHCPGDEKRMVVILDPKDYDERLSCPVKEAPKFFRQWNGMLLAFPKPLPGKTQRPNDDTQPGLF